MNPTVVYFSDSDLHHDKEPLPIYLYIIITIEIGVSHASNLRIGHPAFFVSLPALDPTLESELRFEVCLTRCLRITGNAKLDG